MVVTIFIAIVTHKYCRPVFVFTSIFIWLELPHTAVAEGSHMGTLGHRTAAKEQPHVGHGFVLPPTPIKTLQSLVGKSPSSDRAVVKVLRVKSCQQHR